MRIEILPEAREDLIAGIAFTRVKHPTWGVTSAIRFWRMSIYWLGTLVHVKVLGYHRSLSKRLPFAIYYRVEADVVRVRAILDCCRNPSWIRRRIGESNKS